MKTRCFSRAGHLMTMALGGWIAAAFPSIAYPPAPHHTLFGMVRNQWGEPLEVSSALVVLETSSGAFHKASVVPREDPGINYSLEVPMDAGITTDTYKPSALKPLLPFTLKVVIGQTVYLPIEMKGSYAQIGQPGKETRIDLTLGEDSDGDGMPDAWERALIAALGGGLTLADIRPQDDSDHDGMSNLNEYLAGTYAFDASDGFSLSLLEMGTAGPIMEFLAIRGRTYSIKASSDLREWEQVNFTVLNGPSSSSVSGPTFLAADTRRIRVQVSAPPGTGACFKAFVR